jgi:hypothetical protein
MGDRSASLYPGRETPGSARSLKGRAPAGAHQQQQAYDPTQDDPLDHAGSVKTAGSNEHAHYVVAPSIQVRPEFPSLTRSSDQPTQPLTCIVVIELPGKRQPGQVPGPAPQDAFPSSRGSGGAYHARQETAFSAQSSPRPDLVRSPPPPPEPPRPRGPQSPHQSQYSEPGGGGSEPAPYSPGGGDGTAASIIFSEEDSPFAAITDDLRARIADWKGHAPEGLGPLQMYDLLSVRREALVREFYVYLFKEAIICVTEERKRTLGRFLAGDGDAHAPGGGAARGVLRLKGRIFIRHIKHVTDTSVAGELSLTIDMEDERLDSFILVFRDRPSLETWRAHILELVALFQRELATPLSDPSYPSQQQQHRQQPDLEEFGGSAKAARMLSGSTGTTVSTVDSLLKGSQRSTMSSSTSHGSGSSAPHQGPHAHAHHKLAALAEDDELSLVGGGGARYDAHATLVTPHLSAGPSNSLTPLPHPHLDLILVVSVPPPHAVPSTAALKVRVIKAALDFVVASLGARDRLSLVTFEVGAGGRVRKTPFLCVGRTQSRARLAKFVDEIGLRREDGQPIEDEFLVRGSKDEKTDVVTAVNHGRFVCVASDARADRPSQASTSSCNARRATPCRG